MKTFFQMTTIVIAAMVISISVSFAMSAEDLTYYTEDYPPYNYEKDGELTGISVDTLKLVWEEMGVAPQKIELVPWARGYNKLKKSSGTCLFATTRTPERENLFKWACPVAAGSRNVLIAKKDRNISIDSIEAANQYKIGAIRDDVAEQLFLSEGGDKSKLESVAKMETNLKKMQAERIDLLAYAEKSAYKFIEENGYDVNEYETVFLLKELPLCLSFHKDTPDGLVGKFRKALGKVVETEEYRKILEKHE